MDYGQLGTVAGLSAATTVIVALVKGGVTVSGRATHVLTVLVSLGLAAAAATQGLFGNAQWLQVLLTGVYAAAAAVGLHQAGPGVAKGGE